MCLLKSVLKLAYVLGWWCSKKMEGRSKNGSVSSDKESGSPICHVSLSVDPNNVAPMYIPIIAAKGSRPLKNCAKISSGVWNYKIHLSYQKKNDQVIRFTYMEPRKWIIEGLLLFLSWPSILGCRLALWRRGWSLIIIHAPLFSCMN